MSSSTSGSPARVTDPVRIGLPGLTASRAAIREFRVGAKAFGAQRFLTRAATDRRHHTAPGASRPPRLAGVTPRLSGGAGDLTKPCATADPACHCLAGTALLAPRPLQCACGDPSAPAAADAVLQVGRVVDEAVRAERSGFGVTGGRLAGGSAAGARHRFVAGEAVPADPSAV